MLTKREEEALRLLVQGMLNKEMAVEMDISVYTVKNHLKSMYKKLKVRNRAEAIINVHKKRE